jgi:phosphoribosylanthranilate isomerase
MFRIKICGITNATDALAVAEAGADAIGLNFYSKSRRFVDQKTAQQIVAVLPSEIMKVGVFVNDDKRSIESIASTVGLDAIQLHGDEQPAFIAVLPNKLKVLRALRCTADINSRLSQFVQECEAAGRLPDAVLLDADAGAEYGGTGECADWDLIAQHRESLSDVPLILAGGLTPTNVAGGITAVGPTAVDVASGVESSPGKKDHSKLRDFIAAARDAFDKIS